MTTDSGTMLESGINSVAAALTLRNVASLGIESTIRITGEGMNHIIEIALPDGRKWTIRNAREWFELEPILRRGTDEIRGVFREQGSACRRFWI